MHSQTNDFIVSRFIKLFLYTHTHTQTIESDVVWRSSTTLWKKFFCNLWKQNERDVSQKIWHFHFPFSFVISFCFFFFLRYLFIIRWNYVLENHFWSSDKWQYFSFLPLIILTEESGNFLKQLHFKHQVPSLTHGNTSNCFVLFPCVIY